jgi:hypothetical protein
MGPAINLHNSICGAHRVHPSEADADVGDIRAALGPPITTRSPVVVSAGVSDPGMIAKAATSMGVGVDVAPLRPKKSTGVPLPRLRPAHIPGATAAMKPGTNLIVFKS